MLTYGHGGHGVLAQTIGGGGLIGDLYATDLTNAFPPTTGDGQSNGSGGAVTVTVDQNPQILTLGHHSYGIIAQSVVGGGGLGAHASPGMNYLEPASTGSAWSYGQPDGNGNAGGVTVVINGTTAALGNALWAVYAQSNSKTSDPITVSIANGSGISVMCGRNGGGGGIYLSQGAMSSGSQNSVTNNGTLITAAGISETEVTGDSGNNFIDNNGTITGSIELASGRLPARRRARSTPARPSTLAATSRSSMRPMPRSTRWATMSFSTRTN